MIWIAWAVAQRCDDRYHVPVKMEFLDDTESVSLPSLLAVQNVMEVATAATEEVLNKEFVSSNGKGTNINSAELSKWMLII